MFLHDRSVQYGGVFATCLAVVCHIQTPITFKSKLHSEVEIMPHSHFKQILNSRFCQVYAMCVHVSHAKKDSMITLSDQSSAEVQLLSMQNARRVKKPFSPKKRPCPSLHTFFKNCEECQTSPISITFWKKGFLRINCIVFILIIIIIFQDNQICQCFLLVTPICTRSMTVTT